MCIKNKEEYNMSNCFHCWGPKLSVPECYWRSHIEFGYRAPFLDFKRTFLSVFNLHNETMNIWSHLIGFLIAIYIIISYFYENNPFNYLSDSIDSNSVSSLEAFCFGVFLISAAICLFFSTVYHWFNCMSPKHHDNLLMLDLTGIALLVGCSYLPAVYFGFYCYPQIQAIYLGISGMIVTLGLAAVWIEIEIYKIKVRPFIFASLVAFGVIPSIHWNIIAPSFYRNQIIFGFIGMFFWYAVGFYFFISRFPESHFPNNYWTTYVFPSHTIWHICVLLAVYTWFTYQSKFQNLMSEYGCQPYDTLYNTNQ